MKKLLFFTIVINISCMIDAMGLCEGIIRIFPSPGMFCHNLSAVPGLKQRFYNPNTHIYTRPDLFIQLVVQASKIENLDILLCEQIRNQIVAHINKNNDNWITHPNPGMLYRLIADLKWDGTTCNNISYPVQLNGREIPLVINGYTSKCPEQRHGLELLSHDFLNKDTDHHQYICDRFKELLKSIES